MLRNIFGIIGVFMCMVFIALPIVIICAVFALGTIGYILIKFGLLEALLFLLLLISAFIWWAINLINSI